MPSADVSHARPLRAVVPGLAKRENGRRGEDYSEFLICSERPRETSSASVCKQRNAALERQTVRERKVRSSEAVGFCSSPVAPGARRKVFPDLYLTPGAS